MNKGEQLAKALEANLAEVKPRRVLLYKYYQQYLYGSEPTLKSQIIASFFAQELVTLEAKSACACYLAFRKIYAGEIRSNSGKLKPVCEALKAAGYNFDSYDKDCLFLQSGKFKACASFCFGCCCGRGDDWRHPYLSAETMEAECERLNKALTNETPAEIISRAEIAFQAWKMQEAAKEKYSKDCKKLRALFGRVFTDDWHKFWTANSCY